MSSLVSLDFFKKHKTRDTSTASSSGMHIPIPHFPPRPKNTFSDALRLSASYAIQGKFSAGITIS